MDEVGRGETRRALPVHTQSTQTDTDWNTDWNTETQIRTAPHKQRPCEWTGRVHIGHPHNTQQANTGRGGTQHTTAHGRYRYIVHRSAQITNG
jgi:hypothetical protein